MSIHTSLLVSVVLGMVSSSAPSAAADEGEPLELARLPRLVAAPAEPQGAFPPPPPTVHVRTLSLGVAAGPGWLTLNDKEGRDGQGAFGFAVELGVVVAPEWNAVLELERTATGRRGATFAQTVGVAELQGFVWRRLYVAGGLGAGWVGESGVPEPVSEGPGLAFSLRAGLEALRFGHAALFVEGGVTVVQYGVESWEMGGLRAGVIAF